MISRADHPHGHATPHPPRLERIETWTTAESFQTASLLTSRGTIAARLYDAPGADVGVIAVGGVGGGFDSPARELYARLGQDLSAAGVALLRVRFRNSRDLEEATHDVLAGVEALGRRGVGRVALLGHSFGGAVVIRAAVAAPEVAAVVTLATQGYGADGVSALAPRPVLLLHGTDDTVLPASSSRYVYSLAGEPRTLRLFEGAGHVLDEAAEEIRPLVRDWLLGALARGPDGASRGGGGVRRVF